MWDSILLHSSSKKKKTGIYNNFSRSKWTVKIFRGATIQTIAIWFNFKGALCSFGEENLIVREISSFIDFHD